MRGIIRESNCMCNAITQVIALGFTAPRAINSVIALYAVRSLDIISVYNVMTCN